MSTAAPVVVVGGGVIGLCTAYSLRRRGVEVVVVEQGTAGCGASHGNAGWIVPSLSAPLAAPGMMRTALSALARPHGPLRLASSAVPAMLPWLIRFRSHCTDAQHGRALRATATLAEGVMQMYDELIDDGVSFEMSSAGLLSVFASDAAAERAAHALRPLAEFGYRLPDVLDARQLRRLEPVLGPAAAAGFHVPQERTVQPASLITGLTTWLRQQDVPVLEGWGVRSVELQHGRVSAVVGHRGRLRASAVVVAAGARSVDVLRQLGVRLQMKPGKGYSMSVRQKGLPTRPVMLAEAKVAITPFRDRTRIAGTMEFAGFDEQPHRRRLAALAAAAQPYLTPWSEADQTEAWCGWRPVTPDGLPVIGRLPAIPNAYVATGHAMLGVTLAPATGRAVAELVLGGPAPEQLHPFRLDRPGLSRVVGRSGARPPALATSRRGS